MANRTFLCACLLVALVKLAEGDVGDACGPCLGKNKGCLDVKTREPSAPSGVYPICVSSSFPKIWVYCDMDTENGGWLVFQRRVTGVTDFFLPWESYASGFGDPSHEFWLGNRRLHEITTGDQHCELRIDLQDFSYERRFAKYQNFSISSENDGFSLQIGVYSGDAGDSLVYHNESQFSTKDRDNDLSIHSCAQEYKGGWWFRRCQQSNLNARYLGGNHTSYVDGTIDWGQWPSDYYPMKYTEMKLRCPNEESCWIDNN